MSVRRDIIRSINSDSVRLPTATSFSLSDPDKAFEQSQRLKRSDDALNKAAVELFELFGRKVESVGFVGGIEQEYIIIDGGWCDERTDLMFTGRTLVGMPQPGDHPPDHHNVYNYRFKIDAPKQYGKYNYNLFTGLCNAVDGIDDGYVGKANVSTRIYKSTQNVQLNVMGTVARRGKRVYLLHEKPFAGTSGNGKHISWALTDGKVNYLRSPGDTREEKLLFLTLVASVVHAVYRHGDLLCASAASAGNEDRLGAGQYDPPALISLSLGGQLTKIFAALESGKAEKAKKRDFDNISADILPEFTKYGNDTSPVAFTKDGFKFRMPGSSMNASTFVTVVNTAIADSMAAVCDKIKKELAKGKGGDEPQGQDITNAVMNVLSAVIKESKSVLFEGDCHSEEWAKEALTRGLPSAASVHEAVKAFITPKAVELFKRHAVFSEAELKALYEVRLNDYSKTLDVEIKTLADIVNTRVLPSAYNYQTDIASGLEVLRVLADDMTIEMTDGALEDRKEMFEKLTADIYRVRKNLKDLSAMADKANGMGAVERAAYLFKEVKPQMASVRQYVDALEGSMPDDLWPLPKYKEMLFIL